MDAGKPVHRRASTHTSRNGLVISNRSVCPRIDSSKGEVIHRPLAGCGNAVRHSFSQAFIENIRDSLRGLHVTAAHSGGRPRVHDRTFRCDDAQWTHPTGIRGNWKSYEGPENIEHGRSGDGINSVHTAFCLWIESGKIDCRAISLDTDLDADCHRR